MRKHEESKLGMLEDTASVLESANGVIGQIPMLQSKTVELRELVTKIRKKEEEFKAAVVGKTGAKNQKKEDLIRIALVVSGGLFSYGLDHNDVESTEAGNLQRSDFSKMREAGVITTVGNVLEKAESFGNELESYGVSQTMIEDMKNGLTEYRTRLKQKGLGYAVKSAARETIESLFKAADDVISSIDRLMRRYRTIDPELYLKYSSARIIKDKAVFKKEVAAK